MNKTLKALLEIGLDNHLAENISSSKVITASVLTIFALSLLIFFIKNLKFKTN